MAKRDDIMTIDQIAEMFGLPSWDSIDECNLDYYCDTAHHATKDESFDSEEEREAEYFRIQDATRDELFSQWYHAVARTAATLFERAGLTLHGVKVKGKLAAHPYKLRVKPAKDWKHAANEIRTLINGVGHFHFSTLGEFLRSGPYTARQACLEHIGYVRRHSDIYGSTSAERYYDSAMR